MGKYLDQAQQIFGRDTSGLLDGGHHSLIHSRSMEFDDVRQYVRGDDVRDIDWKATARSGHVLIKRFVSEKHHKILVVVDAGRNATAHAPSAARKCDIAGNLIGAIGLVTLRRSDEIGMVFGDARGSIDIRLRRGATHIESMLHRFHDHVGGRPGPSSFVNQLNWVAEHYRRRLLIFLVSDEPDITEGLRAAVRRLSARHDLLWAMIADTPAVQLDGHDGYDVESRRIVLSGIELGRPVVEAYIRAENTRRERLSEFLIGLGVPHVYVADDAGIRAALTTLTKAYANVR